MTEKNPKFWTEKKCAVCNIDFWSLIKRNQKTCSAKCSGIFVANLPGRIDKIKNTKLEKYGSASYVNTEKAKLTCIKKYGVDNPSKDIKVLEKIKQSNQEKYGVDWVFQSTDVKRKIRKNNLKKYGVEYNQQRDDVRKKTKQTFIKKYGVENPFCSTEIKHKIENTYIEKYNVKHPSQIDVVKHIKNIKWKESFYNYLISNHKLNAVCEPMFSKEEYVNTDRENVYKFKCKKCNNIFSDHIDGGHLPRCLSCFPYQAGYSKSEQSLQDYIAEIYNGPIVFNSRRILPSGLELDIFLPDKNLAIEYNGLYWHSELAGKNKQYHLNKTVECEQNNIHLIQIFEDEWKYKRNIIEEKIKSKIVPSKKIGARQLIIKNISHIEKNKFLESNHIQGKDVSSIYYGGYFNEELVAVCSFSKPRIALGNKSCNNNDYELVRYATSRPLVGALSKFISKFKKDYLPNKIYSYADRRFSYIHKNIYISSGFKMVGCSAPNYWYFENGRDIRSHRYNFRKNVLKDKLKIYDENETEWENMTNNNYNRIFDCGNLRFEI
jgi:hypothetical protein